MYVDAVRDDAIPATPPARAATGTHVLALSVGRTAAAALLADGRPVAAIEEAKLARTAHPSVPARAVQYCLAEAGVCVDDLAAVALSSRPVRAWLREQRLRASWRLLPVRSGLRSADRLVRDVLRTHAQPYRAERQQGVQCYEHHLCHAASAFFPSPFDRALVLTLDSGGDGWSGAAAVGEGAALRIVSAARSAHGLGWLYSAVTELLGYTARRDEHKTQWLATQGTPELLPFLRTLLAGGSPEEWPVVARRHVTLEGGRWVLSSGVRRTLGIADARMPPDRAHAAVIASSLQALVEEAVVGLAERFRRRTALDHLAVGGGVLLNPLVVRALEERTGFRATFVYPVAGNAGAAVGAGYLAAQRSGAPRHPFSDLYLGPSFDAGQIKQVLENCKLVYRYHERLERLVTDVVSLLRLGQCVAWYQGRAEFGARALGNRSILGSPFSPYIAENLNRFIKHREPFHPFVLAVPAERAGEWFDCTRSCGSSASVGRLRTALPGLEPFAVGSGRVRVHAVEKDVNPRFWRLLHAFGERSPAPVLVNTSFNLFGEPLVCDPRDAVRSFYCAGIDALAIGDFLVLK